jgi:ATP-dependent helicase HrpB
VQKVALPIDPHLDAIASHLKTHNRLILQATPGSGKTTRVAPYLLDTLYQKTPSEIWVLEPRRLAARLAANRVAYERGQKAGEEIGYQFRWEKVVGPRTRVRYLTEGTLVRLFLSDRRLSNVAAVILDEFHERHLQGDQAFALLLELQRTVRPDLRLLLMSATLEAEALARTLDCAVQTVEGRLFPVDIQYQPIAQGTYLDQAVARCIREQWKQHGTSSGDFLVFLPGMAEINRVQTTLAPLAASVGAYVCVLHGDLDGDAQKRAVEPGGGKKIILSTNIAESSVTIEGIKTVIDAGLHRVFSEDPSTGIPVLRTQKTSKASCIQRANRAGRVTAGRCIRLFGESDFYGRPEADVPEILRTDLSHTLLEIRSLGFDETKLTWPSVIPVDRWSKSLALLEKLGAVEKGEITDTGKRVCELPLPPRIGRFLVEAEKLGVLESGISLASLLSEGKLTNVDVLEEAIRSQPPARIRDRLRGFFPKGGNASPTPDGLARSLVTAFPDRIAQRRKPFGQAQESFVLSESGSATMGQHVVLGNHAFFVVPSLQKSDGSKASQPAAKILGICPIEEEWLLDLPSNPVLSTESFSWDENSKRLTRKNELKFGALTLESRDATPEATASTAMQFAQKALGMTAEQIESAPPAVWLEKIRTRADVSAAESAAARIAFWVRHHPEKAGEKFWRDRFLESLVGVFSIARLREVDWENALVPPEFHSDIQRFAPAQLALHTKRRAPIQYAFDKDPWVESRLQDFFGMTTTPTVGGGKVPLTVHLLAPNKRAVQVTRDLTSFWKNTYPELRGQLSRRYPRHAWPEDPSKVLKE